MVSNVTWHESWFHFGWIRQEVSSKFGEQVNKNTHSVAEEHHLHCTHQSGQFDNGNWRHSGDDSGFVGGCQLRFRSLDAAYRWYTTSMCWWFQGFHALWASILEILRMGECQRSGHMMLLVLKSHGCYLQLVAGALGWLIGRDKCQSGVEKMEIIHRSLRDGSSFRFPWCSGACILVVTYRYADLCISLSRIYCVIVMTLHDWEQVLTFRHCIPLPWYWGLAEQPWRTEPEDLLCALCHCRYNQLIWWLEHSRKEQQTHCHGNQLWVVIPSCCSMKQHGPERQNLFACRPSWLRGLEILLDHRLHECSGLPDSYPARGVFSKRCQPTRYSWKTDDGYSWMMVMWWLPCAGDATKQQEKPVGLGWHGDPYWGQTNSRWSMSVLETVATPTVGRSWLWNLQTAHMSQRKARNTDASGFVQTNFSQILQVQLLCVKQHISAKQKSRRGDETRCFSRFATLLKLLEGQNIHGLSIEGARWESQFCFCLDANYVSVMETWKPWKRWKLFHLKRWINIRNKESERIHDTMIHNGTVDQTLNLGIDQIQKLLTTVISTTLNLLVHLRPEATQNAGATVERQGSPLGCNKPCGRWW